MTVSVLNDQAPRPDADGLVAELDRLEFSARVSDLYQAGRIDGRTVQTLRDMADDSTNAREFRTRFHFGGARMMPAAEYRYLVSALETPEGQRPQTWAEAEAYARAWGADRYDSVRHTQQIEQDRELMQTPAYAV